MKTQVDVRMEMVDIVDLVVDPMSQREYSKSRVDRMLRDGFEDVLAGAIVVGEDHGKLYVIDGQTRMRTAEASGRTQVRCVIYPNVVRSERARMFVIVNRNRKIVDQFDLHRVGIVAGFPSDVNVADILASRKLVAARKSSENAIGGMGSVKATYEKYGREVLEQTLDLIISAWRVYGGERWQPDLIRGIAQNVAHNLSVLDMDRYSEMLRTKTPEIWRAILYSRMVGSGGNSRALEMARVFADEYNKGLRGGKRGIASIKP